MFLFDFLFEKNIILEYTVLFKFCEVVIFVYNFRYVRQNVLARANYRKYSTDVPLFLHNRPRLFVEHCMKRWGKVEIDSIKQTKNGFLVDPYNIDMDVPECSCPDFIKTGWPCKHLLAVFQFFPSYGWEFLPQEYTTLPVFNLDDGECQVQQESTVHQHQGSTACSSVRKETIELLSDLKNATYAINSDEVLYKLNSALQDVKKSIEQNIPTIGIIPARTSRTKRKAPDRTSSVPYKYTSDVIMEEDELSKGLLFCFQKFTEFLFIDSSKYKWHITSTPITISCNKCASNHQSKM